MQFSIKTLNLKMKDITSMNDSISNKFESGAFGSIDRMQDAFQKSVVDFK